MRPGMELGVQITIFRPGPHPLQRRPQMWWRRLWRKLPVHRAPPEPGSVLFKDILDARLLGIWEKTRSPGRSCDHDVCFCRYGGGGVVVAGGQRYLGFRIIPDVVDVKTL